MLFEPVEFAAGRGVNPQTVALIHGFPDTSVELYRTLAPRLAAAGFRVVMFNIPGYPRAGAGLPLFGYAFRALTKDFARALRALKVADPLGRAPFVVAHDWGAVLLNYARLEPVPTGAGAAPAPIASRVVLLDVGYHIETNLKYLACTICYQWTLIFIFFLPRVIATPMTRIVARVLGCRDPAALSNIHSGMNYMYLRYWVMKLTGSRPKWAGKFVPPDAPTLFLYGVRKPFMFHSEQFVSHLKERGDGSDAEAFDGNHWFFRDGRLENRANDRIAEFLVRGIEPQAR
jgi:pimeloyl-ACP methyl ester carboxylesterase